MKTTRDPKIGKAWLAYYALQGDEPFECLADYLRDVVPELQAHMKRPDFRVPVADEKMLADLLVVILGLIAASEGGDSPMRLELGHRRPGNPANLYEVARKGHLAAAIVDERVRAGDPVEAAVAHARQITGLSRSEVFSWRRHRKRVRDYAEKLKISSGELDE